MLKRGASFIFVACANFFYIPTTVAFVTSPVTPLAIKPIPWRTSPVRLSSQGWSDKVASSFSQSVNQKKAEPSSIRTSKERRGFQVRTFIRVVIPSLLIGVVACVTFPSVSLSIASWVKEAGAFSVLSQDSSQFVQNYLSVAGVLFSILVGQTYYFLYTQQESIYYALFEEVTEAKSLLEQVALVSQGRSMYKRCLESISRYVEDDLKMIQQDPADLLSARPVDDPLESIMYMTSVGVPSSVYETVKSLREARAKRLGALQRKLPSIHIFLLWVLAAVLLVSFPLLGAGTQTIGGYKLLTVEGMLFGVMTAGIVLTLRICGELWRPAGGAYNVDAVLSVMVSGLERELKARCNGQNVFRSTSLAPSGPSEVIKKPKEESIVQDVRQQGPDISIPLRKLAKFVRNRWNK